MSISATASAIAPAECKNDRRDKDSGGRSNQAASLALQAFMSMDRAVALVDPDGHMLLPNLVFDRLFSGTNVLERINRIARDNNGRSDCQIQLGDGRAFWVETIPMDDGWLGSAYDMTERSA